MTDDIEQAIESTQYEDDEQPVEGPEEQPDEESEDDGMFDGLLDMSGTGKSLDAYEDSPYRSLAGGTAGEMDAEELRGKGEKHVARGIDGLLGGLIDAGHPMVDLLLGFILIALAGTGEGGDGEGYDGMQFSEEQDDETPDGAAPTS